jgi:pimeloyl-ACP methyl ester carboxylesterase
MNYNKLYHLLKSEFDLSQDRIILPNSQISIDIFEYYSEYQTLNPKNGNSIYDANIQAIIQDNLILENTKFRYPVFVPQSKKANNNPIILLHGLNERSWLKYLPWAYRLAEQTQRVVILFPIAYHINRSPESWGNPRELQNALSKRKTDSSSDSRSTFANVALSDRLSDHPIRFFTSGRQSANDLIKLIHQLQNGDHPLFPKGTEPDFFAYSIGAFLAQILFIANPENLFEKSKLFLFCGGALFSQMNGFSKLIMDKEAYENLYRYYLDEFGEEIKNNIPLQHYFSENILAKSFWSMIAEEHYTDFRKSRLEKFTNQIQAISLLEDKVIPSAKIKEIIPQTEILDFDFPYTHETPFPLGNIDYELDVNKAFDEIFLKAANFYK